MEAQTDLGREVRAAVAAALKRFGENDIAAVKVSTLRKLDAYLNPAPESFEINTARTDAAPYEAMSQARIDRLLFGEAV
jgi:hypothetical protein